MPIASCYCYDKLIFIGGYYGKISLADMINAGSTGAGYNHSPPPSYGGEGGGRNFVCEDGLRTQGLRGPEATALLVAN